MIDCYKKVLIGIPAYNHENFIENCLESVVRQNYKNIEVVVIDDCSTDNTASVVENWLVKQGNDVPIKLIKHQQNQGVSRTLNEIMQLSDADYVTFIASDDYLLENSITKRVNFLEKNKNKDAVFSDCIVVDNDGNKIFDSGLSQLYSMSKEKLLSNDELMLTEIVVNWGVPGGTLMIRNCVRNYAIFNQKLIVEDFDFFLKLLAKRKLGFVDVPLTGYRLHATNVSRDKKFSTRRKVDFLKTIYCNFLSFGFNGRLNLLKALLKRFVNIW